MHAPFKGLSWRRAPDSSKAEKRKPSELPAGSDGRALSEAARELGPLASYPALELRARVIPCGKELGSVWKWALSRVLAPQTAAGLSLFLVFLFLSH